MTAQEILNLIKTVDPADIAKMDEIDARVWCYLNHDTHEFLGRGKFEYSYADPNQDAESGIYNTRAEKYTRSRDVLKTIRPSGWYVGGIYDDAATGQYDNGYYFILRNKLKTGETARHQMAYGMPTEELAELHAIIQAIEYERNISK